jgi:taurine dioxygenase
LARPTVLCSLTGLSASKSAGAIYDVEQAPCHQERNHLIPTSEAIGAELTGIDLKNLDESKFAFLTRAWHQYSAVLIRDQVLTDEDLIAFSRRFGGPDWAPIQENGRRFVEGMPEIYVVSDVKVNGEPIGSLGDGEAA